MIRTTLRGIALALVGLLVYGCGNDYTPDVTAPGGSGGGGGSVGSPIGVFPSSAVLDRGQSVQLAARHLSFAGATIDSRLVTWSSSNPTVAQVDLNGLVTAATAGSAIITALSNEGQSSDAMIQVRPKGPKPPPPPPPPLP